MSSDAPDPPPWGTPLFPNRYVWFVLFSAMDVLMTFLILSVGGREANAVANFILERYGLAGMTVFKFLLVTFVILLTEYVGRKSLAAGRRLTVYAIALTVMPVLVALFLLVSRL